MADMTIRRATAADIPQIDELLRQVLMAIVLWSFMAGTVRIVSESFGATLGSALIYTVGGILLLVLMMMTKPNTASRHEPVTSTIIKNAAHW